MALTNFTATGYAEDFRVTSKVSMPDQKNRVVSENKTLFYQGKVYDFISNPEQITIFDPKKVTFHLLNPVLRLQTSVALKQLLDNNAQIRLKYAREADPFLNFLADPTFEQETDPDTGELALKNEFLTYRILTQSPPKKEVARQYADFSDWYAHLNTQMNPAPGVLPYPRLKVNETLLTRGEVPYKVLLTKVISTPNGKETLRLQSIHHMEWKLTEEDRKQIREAEDFLGSYQKLDLKTFVRRLEIASKKEAASKK